MGIERGRETESVMRRWLSCLVTRSTLAMQVEKYVHVTSSLSLYFYVARSRSATRRPPVSRAAGEPLCRCAAEKLVPGGAWRKVPHNGRGITMRCRVGCIGEE